MEDARLVVFYSLGAERIWRCTWKRISSGTRIGAEVIDIIKDIYGQSNVHLFGFGNPTDGRPRWMIFSVRDNEKTGGFKTLFVRYHVINNEPTILREEFCRFADSLLKNQPAHISQIFKDFAFDLEITDRDLHRIADELLDKLAAFNPTTQ